MSAMSSTSESMVKIFSTENQDLIFAKRNKSLIHPYSCLQAVPSKRSQKVVLPCRDRAACRRPTCQRASRTQWFGRSCLPLLWKFGFCRQPSSPIRKPDPFVQQQPAERRSKPENWDRQPVRTLHHLPQLCPKLQQHQQHHQVHLK